MTNPIWPVGLPQDVLTDGYGESMADLVLRSQMDAGPAKQRRRFTAGVKTHSIAVAVTRAQVATFETFYYTTLGGGALPWDWTHPRLQTTVTFRFIGGQVPQIKPEPGAARWLISAQIEQMP